MKPQTIGDLDKRDDLILLTNTQDVRVIKDHLFGFGADPCPEINGFFVCVHDGEYLEIYGFEGIVPYLDKEIHVFP